MLTNSGRGSSYLWSAPNLDGLRKTAWGRRGWAMKTGNSQTLR
ncbi:hypothetical protein ALQ58_200167 [Pseudomonas syringae pv. apii]|nr:hypothetical protein ALQ58_200167 [Pseudomonas syringae pv. apii]